MNKLRYHITISLIAISNLVLAQGLPDDDPPCGVFEPCVPIDGGALFLLGAGIVYGGKKMLDKMEKAE